jgi:protein phosphatase
VTGTGLECASVTDSGVVRDHNEDYWGEFVDPSSGFELLVVCDGMGGHVGGATASREAVAKIGEVFISGDGDPGEVLRSAFEAANAHVHELAEQNPELRGMGTTGVALLIGGTQTAWVVHVGDSRAYLLRDGRLHTMTEDHSIVAQMVRQGLLAPDQAKSHPMRNEIVRSIGVMPEVEPEISRIGVEPGDCFLLCSDGLTEVVPDEDIAALLARYSAAEAATNLVGLANSRGAPDNVTVQVIHVPGGVPLRHSEELPTSPLVQLPPSPPELPARVLPREQLHPALLPLAVALLFALVVGSFLWWTLDDAPGDADATAVAVAEEFPFEREEAGEYRAPVGLGGDLPETAAPGPPSEGDLSGEASESGEAEAAEATAPGTLERPPDIPVWIPVADAP